jgi:class 3 adenylate cyclase
MGYFSYPQAHEDDAQRALYAGLDLLAWMERSWSATGLTRRFGVAPTLRLAADTGRVVAGAARPGDWMTVDSVFGDPVHAATRLAGLAPLNSMVISESTRELVGREFVVEALEAKPPDPQVEPTRVYRLIRALAAPSQ